MIAKLFLVPIFAIATTATVARAQGTDGLTLELRTLRRATNDATDA